jgi:hypothetical protein
MGPTGPQGPSGIVTGLGFDGEWAPPNVAMPAGVALIAPTQCQTAPYTAGTGEFATVSFHSTIQISPVAPGEIFYVAALMSENGAGFSFASPNAEVAPLDATSGVAHVGTAKRVPLVAGTTYVFAAGFATGNAQTAVAGVCHGIVTISKQ